MERDLLFQKAKTLGFGAMGVCAADEFKLQRKIVEEQPPLAERRQLHFNPKADYP